MARRVVSVGLEPELHEQLLQFSAAINLAPSQAVRYVLRRAFEQPAVAAVLTEEVNAVQHRLHQRIQQIRDGLERVLIEQVDEVLPEHLLRAQPAEHVETELVELPALPARGEDIVEGEVEEMQGLGGRRRRRRR